MIMPEHDRVDLIILIEDEDKCHEDTMTRLFEVLSNTRGVQDAEASEEPDRVNIMKIIEYMPDFYTGYNVQVNEWLVRECVKGDWNSECWRCVERYWREDRRTTIVTRIFPH